LSPKVEILPRVPSRQIHGSPNQCK